MPLKVADEDQQDKYIRKESFYMVLDSKNASDKSNGSLHSDVTFNIECPLIAPNDCLYITWAVSSFTCPVSFYLINSTNNMIAIQFPNIVFPQLFYIPVGNYNVTSFAAALQSVLLGFTLTFNSCTNVYSLTYTDNFQIVAGSTLLRIMGFAKNTTYSSTNNTIVMPYSVNFSGLHNINIHCSSVRTKNLDSADKLSTSDLICAVNVNASSNGQIYFEKRNDFEFDVKERVINYLDFDLVDDEGNYIDFNNQHWHMCIQVNYIREIQKDSNSSFMDIIHEN